MRFFENALSWGLCAGLVLFTGCAGHHTSSRTAHLLDDKVITDRVEAALRQASSSNFSNVRVDTADAVVTLSGSVPNLQTKEKAIRVAKGVQNVREVDNKIQVPQGR